MQIRYFALTVALFSVQSWAKPEVNLSFKMSPAGDFVAQSATVSGTAKMVGTKVIAENIVVPVATLDAGLDLRTKHMKEKYLEMDKFPQVKLIKAEGNNGQGTGVIEIHGVQKPITGDYKIENNELDANFIIKISDYNIAKVKYLGVGVNDDVKIHVRVPIVK